MQRVLSAQEMREVERTLFSMGIEPISLMEDAAHGLAEQIFARLGGQGKTCVFACGSGGNGGDGYAAARIFSQMGGRAIVLQVYPPRDLNAIVNCELAKRNAFAVIGMNELATLPRPDAWADCIFGIGLTRSAEGEAAEAIERINRDRQEGSKVFACDLPSGLHADFGICLGKTVTADYTITFGCLKRGHLLSQGPDACGEITVHSFGIKEDMLPAGSARLMDKAAVLNMLPERRKTAHKNDFGHLLIIAGSFGMAGACALCANAAMRTGTGLVSVFCPESIVPIIQTLAPCAMCIPAKEENGAVSDDALAQLVRALNGKTALAVGPGLTLRAGKHLLKHALSSPLPAVIDADALNIISMSPDIRACLGSRHAITPHPGEAARLLGELSKDACRNAVSLTELGVSVLYKGAVSVIACRDSLVFSASGVNAMAKGGSGDALTGMVGAFLAMGLRPENALMLASELHGIAGEKAAGKYGSISMLPTDLVTCIGDAYEEVFSR